jgi:hypothetical protein
MRRAVGRRVGWLAAGLAAGVPCAGAQPADPTAIVVRYHEAARAAELCDGKKFTRAEYDKLAVLIGQETQHRLLVGDERTAIRAARADIEARVTSSGCGDPLVVDAIGFFHKFKDRLR